MKKLKLGVLVSGRGSNLQAIMDSIEADNLNAEVAIVISDKANSFALERIKDPCIAKATFLRKDYRDQIEFEENIAMRLQEKEVDLVVLAGFMRVLSSEFIQNFPEKIINIHPSLLPSFSGLHAQRQAIEYGVKYSGCTVHFVNEEVDGGPIIAQAVVEVQEADTEESLSEKILIEEHRLLPKVIQEYASGNIEIKGRCVLIKGGRELK